MVALLNRAAGYWQDVKRFCQKSQQSSTSNTNAQLNDAMYTFSVQSEESFIDISKDPIYKEAISAVGSVPSPVCPITRISGPAPSDADGIVAVHFLEGETSAIYMSQQVHIIDANGNVYEYNDGHIDTCNNAQHMLIGKALVKELGLPMEPLLGHIERLQGINGEPFRPTRFVRMKVKLPMLDLDWEEVTAYVIDGYNGLNFGYKAIKRFGLLERLHAFNGIINEWVWVRVLSRRPSLNRTDSPSSSVLALFPKKSKADEAADAKKRQQSDAIAARISSHRENHYQNGTVRGPFEPPVSAAGMASGQSTPPPSIVSSATSATMSSTESYKGSISQAPTWSTSATSLSARSTEQRPKK